MPCNWITFCYLSSVELFDDVIKSVIYLALNKVLDFMQLLMFVSCGWSYVLRYLYHALSHF